MAVPSAQNLFDRMAVHLLTQNERSEAKQADGDLLCLYRHPKGLKCPVGALITDRNYRKSMDDYTVMGVPGDALYYVYDHLPKFFEVHKELLFVAQHVHDAYKPVEWRKRLVLMAGGRKLSTAAIDNWQATQ